MKAKQVARERKQYHCPICFKGFPAPWRLRRHELQHTGEKPFTCDLCGQCFTSKYGMKSHKLKHFMNK